MILRSIITHFRKQEWTAIAIGFLIVVVALAAFNGHADVVRFIGNTHEMQLVNLF